MHILFILILLDLTHSQLCSKHYFWHHLTNNILCLLQWVRLRRRKIKIIYCFQKHVETFVNRIRYVCFRVSVNNHLLGHDQQRCDYVTNQILIVQVVQHHIEKDCILEFWRIWLNPDHANFLFGFVKFIGKFLSINLSLRALFPTFKQNWVFNTREFKWDQIIAWRNTQIQNCYYVCHVIGKIKVVFCVLKKFNDLIWSKNLKLLTFFASSGITYSLLPLSSFCFLIMLK